MVDRSSEADEPELIKNPDERARVEAENSAFANSMLQWWSCASGSARPVVDLDRRTFPRSSGF